MAVLAGFGNGKCKKRFSTIVKKDTVPDNYSWHQLDTNWSHQPDTSIPDFNTLKVANSLPDKTIYTTEHAVSKRPLAPSTTSHN